MPSRVEIGLLIGNIQFPVRRKPLEVTTTVKGTLVAGGPEEFVGSEVRIEGLSQLAVSVENMSANGDSRGRPPSRTLSYGDMDGITLDTRIPLVRQVILFREFNGTQRKRK